MKIFAEVGIGNNTFLSTEIEKDKREHRIKGFFLPPKIDGIYIRIWVGKRVYALSSNRFFNTTKKAKSKFKLIFGIEGKR